MSPDELTRLRKKIADRKEDRARAQGAVAQLESRLPTEFGVPDVEAAEKLLADLNTRIGEMDRRIEDQKVAIDADLIALGL